MRVVFMGTPDFAVSSLNTLVKSCHSVELVITQPDKTGGRGHKLIVPPVKKAALEHGLWIFQPNSLKDHKTIEKIQLIKPDIIVVVAYGKILPKEVLEIPVFGCINIHASLLPKYRGAAPIQWAIIKGETETGITAMLMDAGLDTGDILIQRKIKIDKKDTASSLHDKLSLLGAEVLEKTLYLLERNELQPIKQEHEKATYAPMLRKEDGLIDWKQSADVVYNLVRGTNPWPGAYTFHNERRITILNGDPILNVKKGHHPGEVIDIVKNEGFVVSCGIGAFFVKQLKPSGRKAMTAAEYVRGYYLENGSVLG